MTARKYSHVALVDIQVPPGSGVVAYTRGSGVSEEAINNLGIHELVGPADEVPDATPPPEAAISTPWRAQRRETPKNETE